MSTERIELATYSSSHVNTRQDALPADLHRLLLFDILIHFVLVELGTSRITNKATRGLSFWLPPPATSTTGRTMVETRSRDAPPRQTRSRQQPTTRPEPKPKPKPKPAPSKPTPGTATKATTAGPTKAAVTGGNKGRKGVPAGTAKQGGGSRYAPYSLLSVL
jgi:outer membrane biosynthesis protein TonB